MSAIGGGGMNIGPLVGSSAGVSGQRRVGETARQQAEAAERKFELDQQALTERAVGDIGASDEANDRDADGRQPWTIVRRRPSRGGASSSDSRATDADAECGSQLDLDA
jgi:hypothetical protein